MAHFFLFFSFSLVEPHLAPSRHSSSLDPRNFFIQPPSLRLRYLSGNTAHLPHRLTHPIPTTLVRPANLALLFRFAIRNAPAGRVVRTVEGA